MIFTKRSVIVCFLSAVKSMNQGFKNLFIGVGENVENPYPWDQALSTSKSYGQSSVYGSNLIPELSAKNTFSDPILFPTQISHEFPTFESNGEHHGELIHKNTGVGGHFGFFETLDASILENYGNLIDSTNFQNSVVGNNLLEADNQRVLFDMPRSQKHESMAGFKRQRLDDVFPECSSNHILQVSNPLNQRNKDPFFSPPELHEGITPLLNTYTYPQLDSEFHDIKQQESLSQSLPIYDAPNAYARYNTGHKPTSPSSHNKYVDANLNHIASSEFLHPNLRSTTHYLDDIFNHPKSIPNHHNDYFQFGKLPVTHNELLKSMPSNIPENTYDPLTSNNFLGHENNVMIDSSTNQLSYHSPNLLENEIHNSILAQNSMTGSDIIDNLNKKSVVLYKPSENHQLSLSNDEVNENGLAKTNYIDTGTTSQPTSTAGLQRYVKKTRNRDNQEQIAENSSRKAIRTYEQSNKMTPVFIKDVKTMTETDKPSAFTQIGGLTDYKLNLYHIHCLYDFKTSDLALSKKDIRYLLSTPSLSYVLVKQNIEHDKIVQINKVDQDFNTAKISSHPIDKLVFQHFQDTKFKFYSQKDYKEFVDFFYEDQRLRALHANLMSIDKYINSILQQLNYKNSDKKLTLEIIKSYKEIIPRSAEEEVYRNFSCFKNFIVSPLIIKSMKPILPMRFNDNKARKFIAEMSTQAGHKRIKCLGLEEEIITDVLTELKGEFDDRLKKTRAAKFESQTGRGPQVASQVQRLAKATDTYQQEASAELLKP
ncbi:expressed protein [Phakopsora pachyrhizi]|uniref:Expressed protein n=1 Tax=Phakopsora pachyrhizi TaxID=170000 RepID=A0AAV0AH94_PHAPC|nr:expressed protein [Phakopsora pachyrhizi]